jgi:hypothetical protein
MRSHARTACCGLGATAPDQTLPSPSLGPPLLSPSWSPPLPWAMPLTTAGGVTTGGAVVGGGGGTVVGTVVVGGGGGVVLGVLWEAGVGVMVEAWEFDMSPRPRASAPAARTTITAMRIPIRLVT